MRKCYKKLTSFFIPGSIFQSASFQFSSFQGSLFFNLLHSNFLHSKVLHFSICFIPFSPFFVTFFNLHEVFHSALSPLHSTTSPTLCFILQISAQRSTSRAQHCNQREWRNKNRLLAYTLADSTPPSPFDFSMTTMGLYCEAHLNPLFFPFLGLVVPLRLFFNLN